MAAVEPLSITIVTPSFNQGRFLPATIHSVLSQGYSNLEYRIIDGGSIDDSTDTLKRYNSELAFWCSEPDEGQYHAINKGFQTSRGEIMAWLNADDIMLPGLFKSSMKFFTLSPKSTG